MRYLNLWCTELPPIIDVMRGPINGAAPCGIASSSPPSQEESDRCHRPIAAAPPKPTPADSEGANFQATPSHEGPGTEQEGEAWVPFVIGKCPLPEGTTFFTKNADVSGLGGPWIVTKRQKWDSPYVTHYRLANPTPRGPCRLPADHPHAALERLYMSDDTLRVWCRSDKHRHPTWGECCPFWGVEFDYYVGHVPPKGAA